jgi:hypothetical protein
MSKAPPIVHVLSIVDGETEDMIEAVIFQSFDMTNFSHQFDVDPKVDPQMLDRYSVGPDDVFFLEKYLEAPVIFDFSRFAYFIEAVRDE